jgi:hypothetical protein
MLHACSSPFSPAAAPPLPTPRCSLAGLAPAVPEISLQIQIQEILQMPPGSSSSDAVLGKIFPFRLPAAQVPCWWKEQDENDAAPQLLLQANDCHDLDLDWCNWSIAIPGVLCWPRLASGQAQ